MGQEPAENINLELKNLQKFKMIDGSFGNLQLPRSQKKKLTATLPQLKFQKGPVVKALSPRFALSPPSPFSTAEPGSLLSPDWEALNQWTLGPPEHLKNFEGVIFQSRKLKHKNCLLSGCFMKMILSYDLSPVVTRPGASLFYLPLLANHFPPRLGSLTGHSPT